MYVTKPLADWQVGDVCDFLRSLTMDNYCNTFVQHEINGATLMKMYNDRKHMTVLGKYCLRFYLFLLILRYNTNRTPTNNRSEC
jgi:hypothetical protein